MIVNASCIIKTYPTDFAFGVVIDDDDNVDDEVGDCKFVAATATTACLSSFLYKKKLIIKEYDCLTICHTKLNLIVR